MRKRAAIALGIIALLTLVALVFLPWAREKTRRILCASCLKSIGLCLMQYSMDNSSEFPDRDGAEGWELLRYNDYLSDYKIYTCPSSATVLENKGSLYEYCVSFVYLGGFSQNDNSMIPLSFDKLGNHKNYVNVLFLNGKVEGFKGPFRNCSDVITMLNEKCKYSPEALKRLKEKAAKLDGK